MPAASDGVDHFNFGQTLVHLRCSVDQQIRSSDSPYAEDMQEKAVTDATRLPCNIVFARLPQPGKVKTRLGKALGHNTAANLYDVCAKHAIAAAIGLADTSTVVCHAGSSEEDSAVRQWLVQAGMVDVHVTSQTTCQDLGVRMYAAFEQHLLAECRPSAVLLGSDIPDITTPLLQRAHQALQGPSAADVRHCAVVPHAMQVVLGPAADGGYWLIGMRTPHAELFQGMQWSHGQVLEHTLQRAQAAGLTVAPLNTLSTLHDIDTVQDVKAWLEHASPSHPMQRAAGKAIAAWQLGRAS